MHPVDRSSQWLHLTGGRFCRFGFDPMRRPYAWFPGKRAMRVFMKTFLAILPRALPETISSAATFQQMLVTTHASTVCTLQHVACGFNNKIMAACAEAVDDVDCLWMGLEKK